MPVGATNALNKGLSTRPIGSMLDLPAAALDRVAVGRDEATKKYIMNYVTYRKIK